jgi:hypothetical protein
VLIESNGESAVITGDMMHHPCQIGRPDWARRRPFTERSTTTRLAFFERFVDTPTLVIGTLRRSDRRRLRATRAATGSASVRLALRHSGAATERVL